MAPILRDRTLMYKIDSHCLGRVLLLLTTEYGLQVKYSCIDPEKKNRRLVSNITASLCDNDVHRRLTIKQCIDKYLKTTSNC